MPDLNPNEIMSIDGMSRSQKADLLMAGLTDSNGRISQRELEEFIQRAFKKSVLIKESRQVLMPSADYVLPNIGFDDDWNTFLIQSTYGRGGQPLGVAERSAPTLGGCTLNARTYSVQVNLPWDMLRRSVEKDQMLDTVRGLIDDRAMADIEKVWIGGDTTSTVSQLQVMDGIIALTSTYTVAAAGARLSSSLLDSAIALLPDQYDTEGVQFFTARTSRNNWKKEIQARVGTLSDMVYTERGERLYYEGYEVRKIPLWPPTMGGTANRTTCQLGDPKNFVFGMFDKVPIVMENNAKERAYMLVMDIEIAAGLLVEPATVSINDILNTAA